MKGKLTLKQAAFVRAYLETGNASEAYRRAYDAKNMKPETIKVKASELLKNGNVAATLKAKQAQVSEKHGITVDRIVAELAKIGFSDIRKAVKWGFTPAELAALQGDAPSDVTADMAGNFVTLKNSAELDDSTAAAISEISQGQHGVKIKFHDKLSALEKLGRNLGMFERDGDNTGTVVVNVTKLAGNHAPPPARMKQRSAHGPA